MQVELDTWDPALDGIVAPGTELERIAGNLSFIEGPIWHPVDRTLIFSDIVGDTMYRWSAGRGLETFRSPSHMANGNTYDRQGRILTCEHATSRVSRTEPDGTVVVLASHYDGHELNSPNDIVVKSDGTVWFTDPSFGRRARVGIPRAQDLAFQAVFRLDPKSGDLRPVADDFGNPNGLCFSLDETQLFVNDSPRGHIRVFQVQPDGKLTGGEVWAEVHGEGPGVPDGLKFDLAGHLYCAGPGGIYVFDSSARCLGRIRMPEQVANFAWGDGDLCGLYIAASTTLYRLGMKVPGTCAWLGPDRQSALATGDA
ncbi:MAG TPA: SMP-30/gluconolactonase/LRE family protein [Anaerolineae bacterium]